MKKYYYKHQGIIRKEECPIGLKTKLGKFTVMVGGGYCQECENYKGGSYQEHYVICKHLQPKRKTNWKKILLRIAAVLSCLLVMFILVYIGFSSEKFAHFSASVLYAMIAVDLSTKIWNLSNKKKLRKK